MAITWAYGNSATAETDYTAATAQNWVVTANQANLTVAGNDGNDVLIALGANDVLYGMAGSDVLSVGGNASVTWNATTVTIADAIFTPSASTSIWGTLYGGEGNDSLIGAGNADTLIGGNGADVLYGGAGNDLIKGNDGADLLYGGDGVDILFGGSGNDTLVGGNGDDIITGEDGNDVLYGNDGADWLTGGAGDDSLDGGAGNDLIAGNAGNDMLYGDEGDDTLSGSSGADTLVGGNGADYLYGGDDNDVLYGNDGNDFIFGDAGNDSLYGGEGVDTLIGNAGDDFLVGGNDADYLFGNDGNDQLYGNDGNDYLGGDAGNDTLYGGAGNDWLYGGTGADVLYGNEDDDSLYGAAGADTLYGGAGNDSLVGDSGDDVLFGEAGNDVLYGNDGRDLLYGNDGADYLDGGAGVDSLYGGNDNDILIYDSLDAVINGGDGTDTLVLGNGANNRLNLSDSMFGGIEVVLGNEGADSIIGSSLDEILIGANGADTIMGGAGNDVIYGNAGVDALWGGEGSDILYGGANGDVFAYGYGDGNDVIANDGNAGDVVLLRNISFADLHVGSTIQDHINGDVFALAANSANRVDGNLDLVFSPDGVEQTLTLQDWFTQGNANYADTNVARTFQTSDGVRFDLYMANSSTMNFAGSTVTDLIYGSSLNDTLGGGNDTISDTIYAGNGDDVLSYYTQDYLYGGNGEDTVTAAAKTAGVTIDLSGTTVAATRLNGIEDILGSAYGDTLSGTSGNNVIDGASGADLLFGGFGGNDSLTGGAGADSFFWTPVDNGTGAQTVTIANDGTNAQSDKIYLSTVGFADATFVANGNDLVIYAADGSGTANDSLVIENWVLTGETQGRNANLYRVNSFVDKDGVAFSLSVGNEANNTLYGTSLVDIMLGAGGNDTFQTSGGADSLLGGEGNDFFYYDSLDAKVDGGNDIDTISAASATAPVFFDQANVFGGTSKISHMEYLIGSSLSDSLMGTTNGETLQGGAGNDMIWGYTGNDVLIGNAGADAFFWGKADDNDTILAAGGTVDAKNDVLVISAGSLTNIYFDATSGNDLKLTFNDAVTGLVGEDTLTLNEWLGDRTNRLSTVQFVEDGLSVKLGVANDVSTTLTGSTGVDYLYGGSAGDVLNGSTAGADSLYGNAGNDLIYFQSAAKILSGGADVDTLRATTASFIDASGQFAVLTGQGISGFEVLDGSSAADTLVGSTGNDVINGNGGADMLWGSEGADTLTGGAGNDTYYWGSAQGSDVIANDGANSRNDVVDFSLFGTVNYSNLTFTAASDDLRISFTSESGLTDTLTLQGWMAQQTAHNDGTANLYRVDTFKTSDKVFGLGIGTTNGDNIKGTSIADYISGDEGNDTINGAGGADTILGGAGDDAITFANGIVSLDGGEGTDTLFGTSTGSLLDIGGYISTMTVANIEVVAGGSGADTIAGSSASDTLYGMAGNDLLWGGNQGEADTLYGGSGSDTYLFGTTSGSDMVGAAADNSADTVWFYDLTSTSAVTLSNADSNLTLTTSTGNVLTLSDWGASGTGYKLNRFTFADGTSYRIAGSGDSVSWERL